MRKITKIIIHCSASDYQKQTAKWIDRIHRKRGFKNGIGYHFFLTHSGKVEIGRELTMIGAHCKGYNTHSIGVCIAGDKVFTIAALRALEKLIEYLKQEFPNATIHGHNEFNKNKTCPNISIERFK